jgi:hypothetical protein
MDVPNVDLAFADILDLFNPLQHIPIVSSVYRAITGDEISGPAKVLGGALFGGPLGFLAGMVDAISTQIAGGDLGEMAIAAVFDGEDQGQATALAAADPMGAQPKSSQVAALAPAPEVRAAPAAFRTVAKTTAMPGPIISTTVKPAPVIPARVIPARVLPVGEQTLTGDAALQALAADLRGPGVAGPAALRPPGPAIAPRAGNVGADTRSVVPDPRSKFTAQMLEGLDKYKALTAERAQKQADSTRLLDQAL